jgi:AbrB family looped-hinge helix DNA binding protein
MSIIRKIDPIRRLTIPAEICKSMGIDPGDEIEIDAGPADIVLTPVKKRCAFCGGGTGPMFELSGRVACVSCVDAPSAKKEMGGVKL